MAKPKVTRRSPNILYVGDQLGDYQVAAFLPAPKERVLLEKNNYWRDRWDAQWKAARQYEDRVREGRIFMDDHR